MTNCTQLKEYLVEHGLAAVRDDKHLSDHVTSCTACTRLLAAYAAIPDLLDALPVHEPSDALLASTADAIEASKNRKPSVSRWNRQLAMGMGTAMVVLAVFGLSQYLVPLEKQDSVGDRISGGAGKLTTDSTTEIDKRAFDNDDLYAADDAAGSVSRLAIETPAIAALPSGQASQSDSAAWQVGNGRTLDELDGAVIDRRMNKHADEQMAEVRKELAGQSIVTEPEPEPTPEFKAEVSRSVSDHEWQPKSNVSARAPIRKKGKIEEIIVTGNAVARADGFDFLQHYQQTDGLNFQSTEGYWSNAYVPGDPQIRLLSARLASWDRAALGDRWRLEQDVAPVKQPFDAPENNALALTLMGDANAIDGPTRMRLQVGIRGIEHLRGQRPALNLSVVVDLPDGAEDAERIATRALVDALLNSKRAGDRFSLVASGGERNLTITPDDFRFGPLQLATQTILGQRPQAVQESTDLLSAMHIAAELVRSGDDPGQPLGSSAILLISAGDLTDIDALTAFAHQQARGGITLSVFPLGDRSRSQDVERLVLNGLGNRRYLESPDRARTMIEEELHSASRAVARAARLSIRLVPGVHLVEVVGSHRLNLAHSQRVKEIETSMDQRLRTNLGIQADRGDDEDGIQIIIPSVFAGDNLTVLLDVVVDQAGPIADVSLRYKDLVFKKNGTLRSHFELKAGTLDRGPSERAVLKNLVAHYFGQAVTRAADALGDDQVERAMLDLSRARATLVRLRREVATWQDDRELIRDQQILEHYLSVLATPESTIHQPLLADSLRYAGWAKAHGRSGEDQ